MIDQNVCDRVIQHVCKHKPYAPMLLAIFDTHIETVYCTTSEMTCQPAGLTRLQQSLFAQEFYRLMQAKGRPLYLAQAGVVSLVNDVDRPNLMHVCITDIEGKEQISYTGSLKACLCCYETLALAPGWKGGPFMLCEVIAAYRSPAPSLVCSTPAHAIKFSNN